MALLQRGMDQDLLLLLEEAGGNAQRASARLRELITGFPDRRDLARDVLLCEREGDRITHDIIRRLNVSARRCRPFGRRDGHTLAAAIDDIVDYAEETADALGTHAVEAPMEQAEGMAAVLEQASEHVAAALRSFRAGPGYAQNLVEIHRLENEGDRLAREAVGALFAAGIDPMVVIRWKDIFDSLEQAIDACEKVAHLLEGIALKNGRH